MEHTELSGDVDGLQVIVGEETWIHRGVGDAGHRREHPICQVVLAGQQRRVRGAGQPLAQHNQRLQVGFLRGNSEARCAVQHVRMGRRAEVRPSSTV